jgi:acetolactate synthase small subunit
MPVTLATEEAEIRRITIQSQPQQIVRETLSQKTHHKKGLVEWIKVKALSSNPSTEKKI